MAVDDEACGVLSGDGPAAAAAKRTAALAQLFAKLRAVPGEEIWERPPSSLLVPMLAGWRDEPFAVRKSFHADAACVVERAAAPLLGVPAYGVFCNGYVCDDSPGGPPAAVWVGRRSAKKPTWPGRLDSVAAGGLAAGELPLAAMRGELAEEAGIEGSLLEGLKSVSCVSYQGFSGDGWGLKVR